jgi:hypothetical protein
MKRTLSVMITAIVALAPQMAAAKDFCFLLGSTSGVFADFTVPAKGTCKTAIEVSPSTAGLVASGAGCTTSDGKTLLFTLSDGFFNGIQTIQGSITLAGGSRTAKNCLAVPGESTSCAGITVTVQTCPKKPAPITASVEESGDSAENQP